MSDRRTRAWRRANTARCKHRDRRFKTRKWHREKSWKLLYCRKPKLRRAQMLGRMWPNRERLKLMSEAEPLRVLFVCSRNQWRSPTCAKVWGKTAGVTVRSAGTSRSARRRLSVAEIRWADLILVMEEKHKSRIAAEFRDETRYKPMHVLDIPDNYRFMDPELVEIVIQTTEPLIGISLPKVDG